MVNKTSNNGHIETAVGREAIGRSSEASLRPSRDQSGDTLGGSILGLILVNSGPYSRPYLGNLINNLNLALTRPWVGLSLRNMLNMGTWRVSGGYPV